MSDAPPPRGTKRAHAHSTMSAERFNKRRPADVVSDAYKNRRSGLATTHAESRADPSKVTLDQTGQLLRMVDPANVVQQFREHEPQVLETAFKEVNWYSLDPQRPVMSSAYCIKGTADDEAIHAIGRTIAALSKRHNAPVFNIKIEFEHPGAHKRHLALMAKQIARVCGPSEAADGAESAGETEAEAEAEDGIPDMIICAHCGNEGHELGDCAIPSRPSGGISGCPSCNTKKHSLDECELLGDFLLCDPVVVTKLLNDALWRRGNKPQIRSLDGIFYDVLDIAMGLGMLDDKFDKVVEWPWSNAFAKEMAKAEKGAAVLGGRKHPTDFNPVTDKATDLPADPLFAGKTVGDVLAMLHNHLLDGDRFIPRLLERPTEPAHVKNVVLQVMGKLDYLDRKGRPRSRAKMAEFLKIKRENGQDAEMGLGDVPSVSDMQRPVQFKGNFYPQGTIPDDDAEGNDGVPVNWTTSIWTREHDQDKYMASPEFEAAIAATLRKFYTEEVVKPADDDLVYRVLCDLYSQELATAGAKATDAKVNANTDADASASAKSLREPRPAQVEDEAMTDGS